MSVFVVFLLFVAILIIAVLWALGHKSQLIFGTYPTKSTFYSVKYTIALWLLRHVRLKLYDPAKTQKSAEELEQPRKLGTHPASYDVVSFVGCSQTGQLLFMYLERRRRGVFKICFYLHLPNEGILSLPKLPDMVHFSTDGNEENPEFRGCGFHIFPEQYLRRWRLRYSGPMCKKESGEMIDVKVDLVFQSQNSYFDYNRDLSTAVLADAVACEGWDLQFLNMLLSVEELVEKRRHYEQVGSLTGNVDLSTGKLLVLDMRGYKDHNFGTERLLSQINRYVYMALFTQDGNTLVVGNISQPSFIVSVLKVGYVHTAAGKYDPITESNFELYAYGEKGTPPQHQNFMVSTATNKYFVQLETLEMTTRYSGGNWESKIYNQFVKCTVNGVKGYGVTEFMYRHADGRPEEVGASDPDWYKRHVERSRGEFVDDFGNFDLMDGR